MCLYARMFIYRSAQCRWCLGHINTFVDRAHYFREENASQIVYFEKSINIQLILGFIIRTPFRQCASCLHTDTYLVEKNLIATQAKDNDATYLFCVSV